MSRPKTVYLQAVNVRIHERPSADAYVAAFEQVRDKRITKKFWGDRAARLLSFDKVTGDDGQGGLYVGEFGCFTDFDEALAWINLPKGKAATQDQVEEVRKQTANYRPQFTRVSFVFVDGSHRFFVDSRALSARMASVILKHWLEDPDILGPGMVAVTVQPEREKVEEILALPRLMKLRLVFEPPNPDQPEDLEQEIEERMKNLKAKRMEETFDAQDGESLVPDEEMKQRARIAAENGLVRASGRNENNRPVYPSTEDHPLNVSTTYSPKKETKQNAMVRLVLDAVKKLKPPLLREKPKD